MATKSQRLYRITSFKHLVDLFQSKEIHFASPASWDDPYERVLQHRRSSRFFAQCWCKKSVSDAMWRIYSQDRTGIRIRTTREKLRGYLRSFKESNRAGYLLRDVRYLSTRDLHKEVSRIAEDIREGYDVRRAAGALMLKRNAFEHEAEVRVVVDDRRPEGSDPLESIRVPVDPHDFIENIYFDPRSDDTFEKVCTHYLRTKLKYRGKIGRSSLYRDRESLVVD